jgi:hypothetical protein
MLFCISSAQGFIYFLFLKSWINIPHVGQQGVSSFSKSFFPCASSTHASITQSLQHLWCYCISHPWSTFVQPAPQCSLPKVERISFFFYQILQFFSTPFYHQHTQDSRPQCLHHTAPYLFNLAQYPALHAQSHTGDYKLCTHIPRGMWERWGVSDDFWWRWCRPVA